MPDLFSSSALTLVFINVVLAWSFWRPLSAGQLSLASPGMAAVGAYAAGKLLLGGVRPYGAVVVVAALAAAIVMLPIALMSLRLAGYSFALATLGVSEGIRITINGVDALGGAAGLTNIPTSSLVFPVGAICCLVLLGFSWAVARGTLGRQIEAVSVDELQARALGVSVGAVKVFVLLCQGAAAGAGGALMAGYLGYLDPSLFAIPLLISIFAFVVVGGIRSFVGPFFGAFALSTALQFLALAGNTRYILFGVLLVLVILVRRDGVLVQSHFLQSRRISRLLKGRAMAGDETAQLPATSVGKLAAFLAQLPRGWPPAGRKNV